MKARMLVTMPYNTATVLVSLPANITTMLLAHGYGALLELTWLWWIKLLHRGELWLHGDSGVKWQTVAWPCLSGDDCVDNVDTTSEMDTLWQYIMVWSGETYYLVNKCCFIMWLKENLDYRRWLMFICCVRQCGTTTYNSH